MKKLLNYIAGLLGITPKAVLLVAKSDGVLNVFTKARYQLEALNSQIDAEQALIAAKVTDSIESHGVMIAELEALFAKKIAKMKEIHENEKSSLEGHHYQLSTTLLNNSTVIKNINKILT